MSEAVNLVILGASGDLTNRLLLPGLGTLLKADHGITIHLVGAGAEDWDQSHWREIVKTALSDGGCSSDELQAILDATKYVKIDASSGDYLTVLLTGLQ